MILFFLRGASKIPKHPLCVMCKSFLFRVLQCGRECAAIEVFVQKMFFSLALTTYHLSAKLIIFGRPAASTAIEKSESAFRSTSSVLQNPYIISIIRIKIVISQLKRKSQNKYILCIEQKHAENFACRMSMKK